MSGNDSPPGGRNLLSLDGGGIRGAVELIILDYLMVTIQSLYNLPELPLPCDYFDLIGGTSTGGLNAVLLGRLRMSTQEALAMYPALAKAIFGASKSKMRLPFSGSQDTARNAKLLELEIKKIISAKVKEVEGNRGEEEPMIDGREGSCRVFVLAVPASHANDKSGPRLITTYLPRIGRHFSSKIWEAVRATCAIPELFERIKIGLPGFAEWFIDGGLGGNNPIKQVISESATAFGTGGKISCIISIGAGILKHAEYKPGRSPDSLVDTLIKISTDCESIQQEIANQFQNIEHVYFRFNVEQGLQDVALNDWNRLDEVMTHTMSYLRERDVQQKLENVAELLFTRPAQLAFGELRPTKKVEVLKEESSTPVQRAIRPPPAHFYGRTEYVDSIVGTIVAATSSGRGAHICIRGYGGIGKTSVALAVCHHPTISSLFGQRRFFVNCENAVTSSLLLQVIASELQIDVSKGDALALVESGLAMMSKAKPLLLVLDNAESFLYSSQDNTGLVDETISRVASISLLTLVLTKRGLEQPFRVKWDPLEELGVLSLDAARDTFLAITHSDEHASSPLLNGLLVELDCVPLAVSLCAQVVQSGGEGLEEFRHRWNKKKIDLLKLRKMGGDSKDTSVQVSIEVSLQSPLLSEDGGYAKRLLRIVAHLPDGIYSPHIERLSDHWQTDVDDAEYALKRLSLSHRLPKSDFLTTLSPIREYVTKHYPILDEDLNSVLQWHLELSNRGNCIPGDSQFLSVQRELTANRGNLSRVLCQALGKHDVPRDILDAVLHFSVFLYWNFPDGGLLELALTTAHVCEPRQRAKMLYRLGEILRMKDDHRGARAVLEKARDKFQAAGDRLGATHCLRSLGDILVQQSKYEEARTTLEKARDEFRATGDPLGAAHCLRSLGDILSMQSKHGEARAAFEKARAEFQAIDDPLGAAQCLQSLGNTLRSPPKHEEARAALGKARDEFRVIGDRRGATQCLQSLGNILWIQSKFEEARVVFEEALDEFQVIGDRLGVTQCLRGLGDILCMQDKFDEARAALEEARDGCQTIGDRLGAAACVRSLGDVFRIQGKLFEASTAVQEARTEFHSIGSVYNLAWCLVLLGEIAIEEFKYDDARASLEEAKKQFEAIGASDGINVCQGELEEVAIWTAQSMALSINRDGVPAVSDEHLTVETK